MFKSFSFLFMLFAIVFFMSAPVFSGGINTDAVGVMPQIDVIDYSNTVPGAISINAFEIDNLYNAIYARSIPAANCRDVIFRGFSVRAGEIKDEIGTSRLAVFWYRSADILYNT